MTSDPTTYRVFIKIDNGPKQPVTTTLTMAKALDVCDNLYDAFIEVLGTRFYADVDRGE